MSNSLKEQNVVLKNRSSDDIYFISTPMQSKHETVLEEERENEKRMQKISELSSFKNKEEHMNSSGSMDIRKKSVPKTERKVISKQKSQTKKKKNQSMSSFVRESFENQKLAYFSSNQHKIDDFLKKIDEGDLSKLKSSNASQLYSKSDWIYIMKSIKLKFPDLSSSSKKNLKAILKKIAKYENEIKEDGSIWSQASSHPRMQMSNDDLKWLYDLNEEQMAHSISFIEDDLNNFEQEENPFVITLSQALKSNENEIISNSESEIEILEGYLSKNVGKDNCSTPRHKRSHEHLFSSHQRETTSYPSESIRSLQFADSIIENHIPENYNSPLVADSSKNEEINSRIPSQVPVEVIDSIQSDNFRKIRESNELYSSDLNYPAERPSVAFEAASHSMHSSFRDPHVKMVISSFNEPNDDIEVQIKESIDNKDVLCLTDNENDIKIKNRMFTGEFEEVVDSEEDLEIISSIPIRRSSKKKRKILRTTRFEIQKGLQVCDFVDPFKKFELKNIGTKYITVDSDNEIEDSEEEKDKSLSIIEITKEIDATADLINLNNELSSEENKTSIMQVPSSPNFVNYEENDEKFPSVLTGSVLSQQNDYEELEHHRGNDNKFNQMTTKDLKENIKKWGLKQVRGRDKMIQILSQTTKLAAYNYNHSKGNDNFLINESYPMVMSSIFANLTRILKENRYWFEKIISFEPLILDELQTWLESDPIKIRVEKYILEGYCDNMGITYTSAIK